MNALHHAVLAGRLTSLQMLMMFGCNVNALDIWRRSPLVLAIMNNKPRMVSCLLSYGAYTTTLSVPMQHIIKLGHKELLRVMVQRGVSLNLKDQSGKTPIYAAVHHGDLEMIQYLVDNGTINSRLKYFRDLPHLPRIL